MFGNFDQNFGIPAFPYQGQDPQGGFLGTNVAPESDPAAAGAVSLPGGPTSPQPSAPAAGMSPAPQPPTVGSPSPLAGGPLAPQATPPTPETAPAAGIGSPFGKPTP